MTVREQGMTARDGIGSLSVRADASVGLVAANRATRRRLDSVLAGAGYSILAAAATIEELMEECLSADPEVAVLAIDLSLLRRNPGLQLLRGEMPDLPIVVVSAGSSRSAVRKALRAGADGYVCEADAEDVLPVTVQAVLAGQLCVPPVMSDRPATAVLSFREKQVLELVALGLTNQEIGERLYLSESTIKSHVSSSFRKLGVSSRAEATAIVLDPNSGIDLGVMVVPLEERAALLECS